MNIRFLLGTVICTSLLVFSSYSMQNISDKLTYAISTQNVVFFDRTVTELEQQIKKGEPSNVNSTLIFNKIADEIPSKFWIYTKFGCSLLSFALTGAKIWQVYNEKSEIDYACDTLSLAFGATTQRTNAQSVNPLVKALTATVKSLPAAVHKVKRNKVLITGIPFALGFAYFGYRSWTKYNDLYQMATRLLNAKLPCDEKQLSEKAKQLILTIETEKIEN